MLDVKSKASCSNQEQVLCVSTGTVGCHVDNHNNALLQTGLAKISSVSQSGYNLKSHLLLDCRSQRLFLSTELCDKFNLPTIRKESVMVKTFGTEQSEFKTLDVVQFCVHGKNNVFVEAFCTPVVCSPLTNQRIEFVKENYPHLNGLELADNTDGQSELKIDNINRYGLLFFIFHWKEKTRS